ncbi:hypothetical protein BH92_27725 (plasmid) [Rhodococcoides fascians A21d2]|uniref:hypothetical protein n=1 Tax=Rhodococcoides fascians TaxID=1828 RepID=UPI00055D8885|nr:hypothetical protein [Rhodococcus fascians]QII03850.1 hypothetical protein BH92_27725 [Rhodococcus fascians A21d2]
MSSQSEIAAAVVAMQLNPDMPTAYCRHTVHGPLSKLDVDASGAPMLVCARCGSGAPLTEEQVRCALGANALPTSPVSAEFGIPAPNTADATPLRRAPLRVETAFGSIRSTAVFALVVAAFAALTLAPRVGFGWALLAALAIAAAVDNGVVRIFRRRDRGRAAWLPGQDMRVLDLEPGTWIETPLNLRATSSEMAAYAPRCAARIHSVTGLPDSPQTGYVELALADGRVYTVPGSAPVRTLHVESLIARRAL